MELRPARRREPCRRGLSSLIELSCLGPHVACLCSWVSGYGSQRIRGLEDRTGCLFSYRSPYASGSSGATRGAGRGLKQGNSPNARLEYPPSALAWFWGLRPAAVAWFRNLPRLPRRQALVSSAGDVRRQGLTRGVVFLCRRRAARWIQAGLQGGLRHGA